MLQRDADRPGLRATSHLFNRLKRCNESPSRLFERSEPSVGRGAMDASAI